MNGYDIESKKPVKMLPTYYQSFKWYVPKVGWVLREEWFTWDGNEGNLINFRERLVEHDF